MLWPVESIIDGTWASGEPPPEFVDYLLMKHMGWSWKALQTTPPYVKRFCFDIAQAEFEHEAEEVDAARRKAEQAKTHAGG